MILSLILDGQKPTQKEANKIIRLYFEWSKTQKFAFVYHLKRFEYSLDLKV